MQASMNWSFTELCDRAGAVDEIAEAFMREVRALGFSHAACASHVDPLKPPRGAVMIVDYPRLWLERYSTRNYALLDPVFLTARDQAMPFRWTDPRFRRGLRPEQINILNEAGDVGLFDGLTIPIHAPHALPASCSLVIGPDGVDPLNERQAHFYAIYAHESARRLLNKDAPKQRPRLSPRERQCIELIAQGKDDFAVSVILGISEYTAHNAIRRAMQKYGVATRMQAFVRALKDGSIRIEDIAD